jgi:hypothetical protein
MQLANIFSLDLALALKSLLTSGLYVKYHVVRLIYFNYVHLEMFDRGS